MLSWVEHEKSFITPGPGQRNSHDLSDYRQQKSGAHLLQQIQKGAIIHLVYRGGIKKGSKVINHNWANNYACIHDVTNSRFKLFRKFTHLLLPIPIPPIQSRRPIYMYTLLNWYLRARDVQIGDNIQEVFNLWCISITNTCLYNFDPLKPHFYIVKLGFTEVYIIFLIFAQNIDFGYSLELPRRGGSNEYPQSMFWVEIWKL